MGFPMRNAATALFVFSSIIGLAGVYLRGGFVCAEDAPDVDDLKAACRLQKRLYAGFLVAAGSGLVFAASSAVAFSIFHLNDADALRMVVAAGIWLISVLAVFLATYDALRKTKKKLSFEKAPT